MHSVHSVQKTEEKRTVYTNSRKRVYSVNDIYLWNLFEEGINNDMGLE